MLRKLWKQEAKASGRTIVGMYGVLAAATIFLILLFLASKLVGEGVMNVIFAIGCSIYALTVITVAVTNFIFLCVRFYQTMYSHQGYLTHTLPVKSTQILHIKLAVSFVYFFLTVIFLIASFLIIGINMDGKSFAVVWELFCSWVAEISEQLNIPGSVFVLFGFALMVLGCLDALLLFFAGSSIGQLFHRSKGACGIAAGIVLYYGTQVVSLFLVLLGAGLFEMLSVGNLALWAMGGVCLLMTVWAVVYYMINRVVVQRHLNLE